MVGSLLLRRTLLGLLTLFVVSILVFFATQVLPGNAANRGAGTVGDARRAWRFSRSSST